MAPYRVIAEGPVGPVEALYYTWSVAVEAFLSWNYRLGWVNVSMERHIHGLGWVKVDVQPPPDYQF